MYVIQLMELYVERCSDFLRMRTQAIEIGDDENPTELIPPCPIKFLRCVTRSQKLNYFFGGLGVILKLNISD